MRRLKGRGWKWEGERSVQRACPPWDRDRDVLERLLLGGVSRSVRDPWAPTPGVCTGVRKKRASTGHSFQRRLLSSDFSLEDWKNESWSETFLKMDAFVHVKSFIVVWLGSHNVSQIRRNYWQSRDNVALPLTGQKQRNHVEFCIKSNF